MILRLAYKDLKKDRLMSLCIIAAMTAVIAPLLLLFSLRYGILSTLEDNLKNNPLNLEIKMLSGHKLKADFFEELRQNPHTGFVIEMTRSLSVTSDVKAGSKVLTSVESLPTAPGDPLVALSSLKGDLQDREIYISSAMAEDLALTQGDEIRVVIRRTRGGRQETGSENFTVQGVIAGGLLPRHTMLMTLKALTDMEDFRDGYEPELFSDGTNPNLKRDTFAKARIYARSIEDVPPLSRKLREQFNVQDKLADIENVKAIARVLNFIFLTVALTSVTGGIIALGGLLFSSLGRKQSSFALLQLTGFSGYSVTLMVVLESLMLATGAYICALLLEKIGTVCFNLYFGSLIQGGGVVSLLTPLHIAAGALITLAVAATVALICVRLKFLRISIAAALREVK